MRLRFLLFDFSRSCERGMAFEIMKLEGGDGEARRRECYFLVCLATKAGMNSFLSRKEGSCLTVGAWSAVERSCIAS